MTTMEEMGRLIRSAPGPRASATQVAHWYERKACLLEHLAEEDQSRRQSTLRQAVAAHQHAAVLLAAAS
jgi:hypothetical protein